MSISHKISLKDHFRVGKMILVYIGILTLIEAYIFLDSVNDSIFLAKAALAVAFLFTLPAFYLHFSYFTLNKKWVIREFPKYLEIEMKKRENGTIVISGNNLLAIDIYMSATMIEYGVTSGLIVEEYNYIKLSVQGQDIIITNLLYPNLKALIAKFPKITPIYHKTIFADTPSFLQNGSTK